MTVPVKFIQGRWFELAVVKLIFLFTSQSQKANDVLSSWAGNVDIQVCEHDNLRTQQRGRGSSNLSNLNAKVKVRCSENLVTASTKNVS